jgi:hypothetical protein
VTRGPSVTEQAEALTAHFRTIWGEGTERNLTDTQLAEFMLDDSMTPWIWELAAVTVGMPTPKSAVQCMVRHLLDPVTAFEGLPR